MRNLFFLILFSFLLACNPQKEVAETNKVNKQKKEKKEGRKLYGKIVSKYIGPMLKEGWDETKRPDLSFQIDNEYYLIKITNESLTLQELSKIERKELKIRGKLIGDGWKGYAQTTYSKKREKNDASAEEEMGYVIIYEILEIIEE
jgi:hypothetical protein